MTFSTTQVPDIAIADCFAEGVARCGVVLHTADLVVCVQQQGTDEHFGLVAELVQDLACGKVVVALVF